MSTQQPRSSPQRVAAGQRAGGRKPYLQPVPGPRVPSTPAERSLDAVQGIFWDAAAQLGISHKLHDPARRRALDACGCWGADPEATQIVGLEFAAAMFVALGAELTDDAELAQTVIARVEAGLGCSRLSLGREVLRSPEFLQLRPGRAIGVQLELLHAFTQTRAVSLWTLWPNGDLKHIAHAGRFRFEACRTRQVAQRLLDGEAMKPSAEVAGVLLPRRNQPDVALVARGRTESSTTRALLLDAVAPLLGETLDRRDALKPAAEAGHDVLAATERRLTRLRFDLHDGPQQDVIMLAEDLRQFRGRLGQVLREQTSRDRLLGRVDDIEARLVALDGDLRRMSTSLESPFMQSEAFPDALAGLAHSFATRSGFQPEIDVRVKPMELTDSQQITLLALVREALNNVREHSDAENVSIVVSAASGWVEATVTDDGHGFDPETALVKAARGGHLGLVGMHERVRMLGGRTQIDSRPGGPTVISVTLPAIKAVPPDDLV